MNTSTDRDVYLEAARLVAEGEVRDIVGGSCCAIAEAKFPDEMPLPAWNKTCHTPLVEDYQALFKPDGECGYWGREWGEDMKECRILALCFMAAMVEAGDA